MLIMQKRKCELDFTTKIIFQDLESLNQTRMKIVRLMSISPKST